MRIYGHRGAAGHAAENTVSSFREAIRLGVHGVEFDVRITKDLCPVVIHDETLDRTTAATGRVRDYTAEELRRMCPEELFGVPTLREVLQEVQDLESINVELKEIEAVDATCDELVEQSNKNLIRSAQILITSFDHEAVARFHERLQDTVAKFGLGLLTRGIPGEGYWSLSRQLGAISANIDLASVNAEFVTRAHESRMKVMVYTVNSAEDATRMKSLGVDAIFSDFPDRVIS